MDFLTRDFLSTPIWMWASFLGLVVGHCIDLNFIVASHRTSFLDECDNGWLFI